MAAVCHFCQKPIDTSIPIGARDHCEHCKSDLHCCYNCKFYDPGYPNECRETFSPFIRDRAMFNFCHFFQVRHSVSEDDEEVMDAKAKLEAVFGAKTPKKVLDGEDKLNALREKGTLDRADESRAKLNSIFKKTLEEEYMDELDDYSDGVKFAEKRRKEREEEPSDALKKLNDLFKK